MRNGLIFRNLGRDLWPAQNDSFEKLMDRFFTPWGTELAAANVLADFNPRADIEETKTHYLFTLDLPGVPKEDVKIEVNQGRLVISGERKKETTKEEGGKKYFEREYGNFMRQFSLPETVDTKNIEARFENGELKIEVPKTEKALPQQIKIN